VQFVAPIEEEIFKALILIYLVSRGDFNYFVDSLIYGFAIGIGFAVVENFEYVLSFGNAGLSVAISRVISTNLIHASATGIVGIGIGKARFFKLGQKFVGIGGGWLIAIALHMGFNNLVTRVSSGLLLLYAAAAGIFATIYIYVSIKRGNVQAQGWIHEKLGVLDRVTGGEAEMVNRLKESKELLAPLAEAFGSGKAELARDILLIQAHIGIQRKNQDQTDDPRMKQSIQTEIDKLRLEMDELRREAGTHSMMMLRSFFPEGGGQLQSMIEARMHDPNRGPGSGMWDKLSQTTQRRDDNPDNLN
jgi:hypothetical protein